MERELESWKNEHLAFRLMFQLIHDREKPACELEGSMNWIE